jgi:hypothetical protein
LPGKRRGLTTAKATILAALIGLVATGVVTVVTMYHGAEAKTTPAPTPAPSISIDAQATGIRQVKEQDDYSGTVKNLQENQVVWMFNQQLTHTNNPKALPSAIYADSGPCNVTGDHWSCDGITVGEPAGNPNAPGTYRVWVAVIDLQTAFRLVQSLQNAADSGHIPDHPEPPSVAGAIDHVDVMRQ